MLRFGNRLDRLTRRFALYTPYWLLNRTGLALAYTQVALSLQLHRNPASCFSTNLDLTFFSLVLPTTWTTLARMHTTPRLHQPMHPPPPLFLMSPFLYQVYALDKDIEFPAQQLPYMHSEEEAPYPVLHTYLRPAKGKVGKDA